MSYVMEVLKNLANKIVLFLIQEISTYLKILSILKTNGDLYSTNILGKWPELMHEQIVQALDLPFIYRYLDFLKSLSFTEIILAILTQTVSELILIIFFGKSVPELSINLIYYNIELSCFESIEYCQYCIDHQSYH